MKRRVVAIYTLLCLLGAAIFVAPPSAPTLVCRMTGLTMDPMVATSTSRDSCRSVAASTDADGTHFLLTKPGCCELRYAAHTEKLPAAAPHARHLVLIATLAPARPVVHAPRVETVPNAYADLRQDAPRGPPLRSAPPRAPPFFS